MDWFILNTITIPNHLIINFHSPISYHIMSHLLTPTFLQTSFLTHFIRRTPSTNVLTISNTLRNCTLNSSYSSTNLKENKRDGWRVWGTDDGSCGIVPQWSPPPSMIDLIKNFYEAINTHNEQKQLEEMLLDDSVYKDLIFYVPFQGKESIIGFLENLMEAMGPNVKFVIDNIAEGDNFTTLVIWHLEWRNKELPFSSGCCFFECVEINGKQYIKNIRGVEEIPVKPGDLLLKLLKAITNFFDRFPFAAEGILLKSRDGSHEGIQLIIDMLGLGKH